MWYGTSKNAVTSAGASTTPPCNSVSCKRIIADPATANQVYIGYEPLIADDYSSPVLHTVRVLIMSLTSTIDRS